MKHTIYSLVVAISVPTIMFIIALLGIQHIKSYAPVIGKHLDIQNDDLVYIENLKANISLEPYLKFDSIQNVCDSAITEFHKRNGRVYYVSLDQLFPDAELKGLRAYTTSKNILIGDFYCNGGDIGDNMWLIKRVNGEYYLFSQAGKFIRIGCAIFDKRDDLWQNLANYKELTKATIILLVSLAIIFISCFLYHPKSDNDWLPFSIVILLGFVWLYGYNSSCGQEKFYEQYNIIKLYIALCWLGCIIALFIPLEESKKFAYEQKAEDGDEKEQNNMIEDKSEDEDNDSSK